MFVAYPDRQSAEARSAEWATYLGCGRQPEDVTRFWYGVEERASGAVLPDGVDVALAVPDDVESVNNRCAQLIREDQMTEAEIAALVGAFPAWATGIAYTVGQLVAHRAALYRVVQAHRSQSDWEPQNVPALFTEQSPPGVAGYWRQPTGAHDAYDMGDRVIYEDFVWESLINANVWSPDVLPSGWRQL